MRNEKGLRQRALRLTHVWKSNIRRRVPKDTCGWSEAEILAMMAICVFISVEVHVRKHGLLAFSLFFSGGGDLAFDVIDSPNYS